MGTKLILIRELAKVLRQQGCKMSMKEVYAWMRMRGYINCYNEPVERYVAAGLMVGIPHQVRLGDNTVEISTTRLTQRGVEFFTNLILA